MRDKNPNNKNKGSDLPQPPKRKKGNVMNKPESVSKINKQFIKEFSENASPKEKKWIVLTLERAIEEKGTKGGFLAFRSEFADKFFPEIVAKNKPKKPQPSFLDEMKAICG